MEAQSLSEVDGMCGPTIQVISRDHITPLIEVEGPLLTDTHVNFKVCNGTALNDAWMSGREFYCCVLSVTCCGTNRKNLDFAVVLVDYAKPDARVPECALHLRVCVAPAVSLHALGAIHPSIPCSRVRFPPSKGMLLTMLRTHMLRLRSI